MHFHSVFLAIVVLLFNTLVRLYTQAVIGARGRSIRARHTHREARVRGRFTTHVINLLFSQDASTDVRVY